MQLFNALYIAFQKGGQDGKDIRLKGEGLLAQALEHEIDHLNGILYIDHIESPDKLQKVPVEGKSQEGL